MARLTKYDVVVVGAGLSGLVAARELVRAGRRVLVLEASSRIGGRLLSMTLPSGQVVDLGGQWVGRYQERAQRLAEELGLELAPTYDVGDDLLALDGEIAPYGEVSRRLPYAAGLESELGRVGVLIRTLAAEVDLEEPWTGRGARELDAMTADAWLCEVSRSQVSLKYWRAIIRSVFATEAGEISLLHFLFYCASGATLDRLVAVRGGAQESRIVGGAQQLAASIAEEFGDAVRLNAPVSEVRYRREKAYVVYRGGLEVTDRVIVAVPPMIAGRIRYTPALPPGRDGLTQRVPMGSAIKFFATYPEPFWREEGLSGSVLDLEGPVTAVYDNSPPDESSGVLVGLIDGAHARARSDRSRNPMICDELARYFGARAGRPAELVALDWSEEPYIRGGYAGVFGPGTWTGFGAALREPVERIHWAGAETSAVSCGYMDGAVRSGERAAREVLAGL